MFDLAMFVCRRLQRASCALLCLVVAQLALAACRPDTPAEPAARLALP
ncbi:MAG: hypothetical protein ABW042_08090 [Phenylobacterium sp.]